MFLSMIPQKDTEFLQKPCCIWHKDKNCATMIWNIEDELYRMMHKRKNVTK